MLIHRNKNHSIKSYLNSSIDNHAQYHGQNHLNYLSFSYYTGGSENNKSSLLCTRTKRFLNSLETEPQNKNMILIFASIMNLFFSKQVSKPNNVKLISSMCIFIENKYVF